MLGCSCAVLRDVERYTGDQRGRIDLEIPIRMYSRVQETPPPALAILAGA
jgi:hypothetical protein